MQRVNQLVLGVGVLLGLLLGPVAAAFALDTADRAAVLTSFDRLPLAFEANAGQTDAAVRFVARRRRCRSRGIAPPRSVAPGSTAETTSSA